MPPIELPNRKEIERSDQKADPSGQTDRMDHDVVPCGDGALPPIG